MAHYETAATARERPVATQHRTGAALAATGVIVVSFDALLVRLALADPAEVLFWRGLFMALSMTLASRALRRRWPWQAWRGNHLPTTAVALGFAATQGLFVVAIMTTRVANVMVIITAAPLFAAAMSGLFLREWVPMRTWIAIAMCVLGIAMVFGGSLGLGGALGDALALCGALVVAGNLTILRRSAGVDRMAMVAGAGITICLVALPFAEPLAINTRSLAVLALMGLLQMPVALVLVTEATRFLPSAEVLLFVVLEVILGTFWVWLALGEEPPGATLLGGGVVIATLVIHSWLSLRHERPTKAHGPAGRSDTTNRP